MTEPEVAETGPRRTRLLAPVGRGAAYGFVCGAALGATVVAAVFVWAGLRDAGGPQQALTLADVATSLPYFLLAGVIGGLYGLLVGAIASIGAVIEPEHGSRRRLSVAAIALFLGVITLALLASRADGSPWIVLPGIAYLVVMTAIAYRLAPVLHGRSRRPR